MKLDIFSAETLSDLELPFADGGIYAGFPSPAQDLLERTIDLNRDLVKHPASTFYARVVGDSMEDADVHDGDILVVDKSIAPVDGDMAVCLINGEFTVKYVEHTKHGVRLVPANAAYKAIDVEVSDRFEVWGVVTFVIHQQHAARRRNKES